MVVEKRDFKQSERPSEYSLDSATTLCYTLKESGVYESNFLERLANAPQPDRELTIVAFSHAESMNQVFPQWVRIAYRRGPMIYEPYDMNMPPVLTPRKPVHYKFDPPLTERGNIVAQTYGRGLALAGITPYEIYCSPDMKSIQTAKSMIAGLDTSYTTICIEPSLMAYRQMYPHNIQDVFLSPKTYSGMGYPINLDYRPYQLITISESVDDYNKRIHRFMREKVARIEQNHVIIISDNCMVEMTHNKYMETVEDIMNATRKTSCQMNCIRLKPNYVKLIDSGIMPFTRCLYDSNPALWSDAPHKLATPNHPDVERTTHNNNKDNKDNNNNNKQ